MLDMVISRADHLTPWHGAFNIARLLVWHSAIVLWAWLGWDYLSWPWYTGLGLFVCLAHQREMNDWAHEAIHWNLHPDRRLNEIFGNIFASFWFAMPLATIRRAHLIHHKTETFFGSDDPDTGSLRIESRSDLIKGILADLSGIGALYHYAGYLLGRNTNSGRNTKQAAGSRWAMPAVIASHLTLFVFLVWIGRWQIYVLYYATLITLYRFSHRIRIYGQHLAIAEDDTGSCRNSTVSRTVVGNLIDKLIFATDVMLYHHEHHNRPDLPYRALRAVCAREFDRNRYMETRRPTLRALWRIA